MTDHATDLWIDRLGAAEMTTAAKALGMALAWLSRSEGGTVQVSLAALKNATGIRSRTTLLRARQELERGGFIACASDRGSANGYTLVMEFAS